MKRAIAAGFAAAVIAVLTTPGVGHATETRTPCLMPVGWYANADEQTRLPAPTPGGLKFSGSDLIHHATAGTVEHLSPGTFSAFPAPDQPSFFSVEVSGTDGGYGTLRWNTTTSKWNLVTGGQFYENASPVALVDMPPAHRSHHVVSFGVGYTANPPGTVVTTVRSVRFDGHVYDLRCEPPVKPHPKPSHTSASPSPSASVSHSASPSASVSTSVSASAPASTSSSPAGAIVTTETTSGDSGALAVTGPAAALIAGGAAVTLGVGVVLFVLARRRRMRFTA